MLQFLFFQKDSKKQSEVTHWLHDKNIQTTILGNALIFIIEDGGIFWYCIMLNGNNADGANCCW